VAELERAGLDVLYDDRDGRPGVKLKDADLIGIPLRIGISARGVTDSTVEWKLRSEQTSERVPLADLAERAGAWLARAMPDQP
jgi:prolyl-tRNA synthetase